jgi:hypothetical protein
VQHLREQGEQRQRDRGILLVTGAEDPRLPQAGPQLELAARGLMLLSGQVLYRNGRRAGRADQDVIRAGRQQGDVAGHEVGVCAPRDAQPGRARGERVEGRARDLVPEEQAPRLGGVDGTRHRSAHAGHREDRSQGIHRFTLRCAQTGLPRERNGQDFDVFRHRYSHPRNHTVSDATGSARRAEYP